MNLENDEKKEIINKHEERIGQCTGLIMGKLERIRKEQEHYFYARTLLQIIMLILIGLVLL